MKFRSAPAHRAAATLCATVLSGTLMLAPAMAQPKTATLYSFHSQRVAGCPGLDWHVMLAPDNAISGFVAWDNMQHIARLSGTLGSNRDFKMGAKEVGGAERTATVSGSARGDYINASIEGSGTACDGKPLEIPRVAGGTEGGGG